MEEKISPIELRTKKLQMYMTIDEYNTFLKQDKLSGRSMIADYLSALVLDKNTITKFNNQMKGYLKQQIDLEYCPRMKLEGSSLAKDNY